MVTLWKTQPTLPKARLLEKLKRTAGFNARVYKSKSGYAVLWSPGHIDIRSASKA